MPPFPSYTQNQIICGKLLLFIVSVNTAVLQKPCILLVSRFRTGDQGFQANRQTALSKMFIINEESAVTAGPSKAGTSAEKKLRLVTT